MLTALPKEARTTSKLSRYFSHQWLELTFVANVTSYLVTLIIRMVQTCTVLYLSYLIRLDCISNAFN